MIYPVKIMTPEGHVKKVITAEEASKKFWDLENMSPRAKAKKFHKNRNNLLFVKQQEEKKSGNQS